MIQKLIASNEENFPHLEKWINNLKNSSNTLKTCLFVKNIFKSSMDHCEERELIIGDSTDDLINVNVRALFINSKENMVGKLRGSNFIFSYADRL